MGHEPLTIGASFMPHPTTAVLRRIDSSWFIELPSDMVRSVGWMENQSIFLHCELGDGVWLSAQDVSATFTELAAFAEQFKGR